MSTERASYQRALAKLASLGITPSENGARCAELVSLWVGGLHNFPRGEEALHKVDWSGRYVAFTTLDSLSTVDGNSLTRLVCLAHDLAIRAEIQPAMKNLRVVLYPRRREGGIGQRHPTLEAAVAEQRRFFGEGLP